MKKCISFFLSILCLTAFYSCETDTSEFKPGYSGSFGELIVVVPERLWNSPTGDSIFSLFNQPMHGFPQNEAPFTVIHVKTEKFSSVLTSHRNIFYVDIEKKHTGQEATYVLKKNKWAKGQIVVEFTAPSEESFLELFTKDISQINQLFATAELNRLMLKNKKFGSKEINKEIKVVQDFNILTQKGMRIEKNKPNLLWLRLEREMPKGGFQHQISQGVLVFRQPYSSKMQFLDTNIRTTIDSILKVEIPGPNEGNYMGIADNYVKPLFNESNFKGNFAKNITGLWEMKGNFFGGPFNLITLLHPNSSEIVYIYGYVFAPQFNKREYLREVQAVMNSITFSEQSQPKSS